MRVESNPTREPRTRARLKAAHRRTACRLEVAFDTPAVNQLSKFTRQSVRMNVTRLSTLVGTGRASGVAETYTRAMLALYEKQARGEDVRLALRAAQYIACYMNPRNFDPPPSSPRAVTPMRSPQREEESHKERTRRELVGRLKAEGAAWEASAWRRHPLGAVSKGRDNLSRYNIREGDVLRFTLDGDAEHGELAMLTYYDVEARARRCYAAFLIVEGDALCARVESHLECDGQHFAPNELTIIGRVVRVERGGLPVRLKGLELRGLPFAEDVEGDAETQRRAA